MKTTNNSIDLVALFNSITPEEIAAAMKADADRLAAEAAKEMAAQVELDRVCDRVAEECAAARRAHIAMVRAANKRGQY